MKSKLSKIILSFTFESLMIIFHNLHFLHHSLMCITKTFISRSKPSTSKLTSLFSYDSAFISSTSISSLHESLPIFDFSDIKEATNNFLNKRYSAAPSWRCTLRGKDVMIFQRKFHGIINNQDFIDRFNKIHRSHHTSIIELLATSISGEYIYLVYNFVDGANLSHCLRNSKNPNFTILSTWISRMQVATDLAHGLDYIHNKSGLNMSSLSHNYIKSSSIIITQPSFNARICHFGAAQLCNEELDQPSNSNKKVLINGVREYMAPEYKASGVATPMTDVYAFGVVILELLSGEEPLKFKFDRNNKGNLVRVSLIESAIAAIESGGDGLALEGRLRRWVDPRLKDSFPIHLVEKVIRLAIQCVDVDPSNRPNMTHVATKISKLYLESRVWSNNLAFPPNLSISLAPR